MSHPFKIKPYREGDALKIEDPNFDPLSSSDLTLMNVLGARSYAQTLWKDKQVLAVGGVFMQWKHCYQAWAVVDKSASEHARLLVLVGSLVLKTAMTVLSPNRIEANVDMSVERNVRYAKLVGLRPEFVKKGAGPTGADVMSMVYKET